MAITFYSGTPPDTYGSDGDGAIDYKNNAIWGPKGLNTAGSWTGTARTMQGSAGLGMLGYAGVPPSGQGAVGNSACDTTNGNLYLKSSGGWTLTGTNPPGAAGPQGFTSVQNFASCLGRCAYANSISTSSTATTLSEVNSSFPVYFVPQNASALTGVAIGNNGSGQFTLSLYDQTSSSTIWSGTSTSGGGTVYFSYTATQYPLTASHVYVWQITGSATASVVVQPFYMLPSGTSTQGAGIVNGFTSPTGTTISSTVQYFGVGQKMLSSASTPRTYPAVRSGQIWAAQGLYIPSTTGAATATATFTIYYYITSSGNGGTVGTFTATNNSVPQVTTFSTPYSTASGTVYYIGVTGSGTGQLDAQLNVIV